MINHWWWGFTRWKFALVDNPDHHTWISTAQLVVLIAILVVVIMHG